MKEQALGNVICMDVLGDCRLKNFFMAPCLRAQLELLQYLISVLDIYQEIFIIPNQELEIDVSNFYFISGLSRRGEVLILTGTRPTM